MIITIFVQQALKGNKLFILDHHDAFIPFMNLINGLPTAKSYATRTILFLQDDGTLKPLAIELSLPHPRGHEFDSFEDVRCLFDGGVYLPTDVLSKISPIPVLKEIFRTDGEQALKFPPPQSSIQTHELLRITRETNVKYKI